MGIPELFAQFIQILVAPWQDLDVLWGIIPVYAALVLGVLYSAGRKVGWGSTVASGFALLWVGLNWGRHAFTAIYRDFDHIHTFAYSLSFLVTVACVALGLTAVVLGLRRQAPRTCQFLGHFTFNTYIFITFYPMQSHIKGMEWTVDRLLAIVAFAVPFWLVVHAIALSLRRRKKK
jgi:hypothetical protein